MFLVRFAVPAVAALVALAGCKSSGSTTVTPPPPPPVISILEGNSQTATVGAAVAVAPAVKVSTTTGAAVSGRAVTFAVASGGGSVTGANQTTDASGIARIGSWMLGQAPGSNTLTATATGATGSPLTFSATGMVGVAATVNKQGGDVQFAVVGTAVAARPSVKVVDQFGNAVAGVTVTFAVASGGGSITGGSQQTGADGIATVGGWTLGQGVGANSLTATATGAGISGNPATFAATATIGAPSILAKLTGDNQTALAGAAVATAPSVKLTDVFGNAIASQTVTFAIGLGGGSVIGATPTTSAGGVATLGSWTLGAAGQNSVIASAGLLSATFTATAQAVLNAPQYNGTYTGTWTNTTFSSTGTGQAIIAVNAGASTANITVNVTGNVLGTGGVPQIIRNGSYGATSAAFSGNVAVMGDITASIDATGHIIASGINVPNAAITRWDANGTITATTLTLNFTVTFTAGPPAIGSINLVKGP